MRLAVFAVLALAACQSSDVSRSLGARCDLSAECDDRCIGPSADWPGGFCTLTCDSDADCPDDAACISEDNGGVCAFRCFGDGHCVFLGQSYLCKDRNTHGGTAATVMVCRGS